MGLKPAASESERAAAARHELFAMLAHELRSPIGAILGFGDLLTEGIFGQLPEPARDALARIHGSAHQLLDLVAGLNDLSGNSSETIRTQSQATDTGKLLADALEAMRPDAASHGTGLRLVGAPRLPALEIDPERTGRAIRLALAAAIRGATGETVLLRAEFAADTLHIALEGARLALERDEPELSLHHSTGPHLSGAGLRIALARNALAPLGGQIRLVPAGESVTLLITLPAPSSGTPA